MNFQSIIELAGTACYFGLGVVALWGLFCTILVMRRIKQAGFRDEQEQTDFLCQVDENLAAGNFDGAAELCADDPRAVPQLASVALANRGLGVEKVRAMLVDRFQRDVLADLEHRMSWVNTMIKSAPMLGLYGTVLGMMAAFHKLSSGQKVQGNQLAEDISLALITTALGLTIAIPLILCSNSINVRIRKLEDLAGAGLARFMETLKKALSTADSPRK